jgi:hypothetical protein
MEAMLRIRSIMKTYSLHSCPFHEFTINQSLSSDCLRTTTTDISSVGAHVATMQRSTIWSVYYSPTTTFALSFLSFPCSAPQTNPTQPNPTHPPPPLFIRFIGHVDIVNLLLDAGAKVAVLHQANRPKLTHSPLLFSPYR